MVDMSQLHPNVRVALLDLLPRLQSPDNTIRAQAEETLNAEWLVKNPEMLLSGLAEQVKGHEDPKVRAYAAILLRKMAQKTISSKEGGPADVYIGLPLGIQQYVRGLLLQAFAEETIPSVRNKVGDAVAELARQIYDADQSWMELLQTLFHASKSPDPTHREGAFKIFAATPGIIEKQHADAVRSAFQSGFSDDSLEVRIAAIEAFSSFFRSTKKSVQKQFYPLLPDILNVLPGIKEAQDSQNLSKILVALIDLAEVSPYMFKPLFSQVVKFGISVIQDKDLGDQARQNALELLATFADNAPNLCKRDPSYASEMVTQCLSLMTDIGVGDDDASEWNDSDDLDVDESDMNHVVGEQCMDRLANKLGGHSILPPTFNWLPRMLSSSAWRDRHAALMAISAISEGCRDQMVAELDKILELVVPAVSDSHPRVRWAGCNALGQMSTDFSGEMQEKYHQVVLSAIMPVLEAPEPRVQSHAAAALVNFCEEAEKEILEPYLDPLLKRLLALLGSPKRYAQEQALSTIATIADSAETAFAKYYNELMPLLISVLESSNPSNKDNRLLNAKAMECASLIALAVGKERLGDDAMRLVRIFGAIQNSVTDTDDPQGSYLLHCWGRMCRVMGNDFLPYLDGVMPPLIQLASAKADVQLLDDEDQIAQFGHEDGWELVPVRGKYIGIKTSVLDDKYLAIELLVTYAQQLEGAFEPYVAKVMTEIAHPGLSFFFNDAVRVASAKLIPQLLNCYKKAYGPTSQQLIDLWKPTCEKLLEVLENEPAVDTLAELYQCFYESVEVVGPNSLSPEYMANFIQAAEKCLKDYKSRVEARTLDAQNADEDKEDSEDLIFAIEDDQTLLSDMNKAFHTIFKNQGVSFLPFWELLIPYYNNFINDPDATQRQWALCIMDDLIEFCGSASWKYQEHFIRPIVVGLSDNVPGNRQAAAYGVGIAAKSGGEAFADFVAACIPKLFEVAQHPQAREDDHVFATENACASIAKVLHYNRSRIANPQAVVQEWVKTLPITNDEEAAPYAYSFLAELIAQKNPAVLQNAPFIFDTVVQALESETLQGIAADRIVEATKQMLFSVDGVPPAQIIASLPVERQMAARKWFS